LELSKYFLDPFGNKRVSSKFIIQTLDRKRKKTFPLFCFHSTGVMTLFYRGLLELSKSFLDPFGNKRVSSKFMAADLEVDVLLAESNAGSVVWPMVRFCRVNPIHTYIYIYICI